MVLYGKKNSTNGYLKLWIDNKLTSIDLATKGLLAQVLLPPGIIGKLSPMTKIGWLLRVKKTERVGMSSGKYNIRFAIRDSRIIIKTFTFI